MKKNFVNCAVVKTADGIYAREADAFLSARDVRVQARQIAAIRKATDGAVDELVAVRAARNAFAPLPDGVVAEMVSPTMRLYRPAGSPYGLPLLIYLHGGGWVIGSIASCSAYCGALAAKGIAVLAVDYPLAPERPFPCALDAVCASYREVVRNPERFGCDPGSVSIGGDSSGGNLSVTAAFALMRDGLVSRSLVLHYPVTEARADGSGSWRDFATGFGMDAAFMDACNTAYLNGRYFADPLISPMCASDEQLRSLPPVHILGADHDVLRDQGIRFARRLKSCGCRVRYELIPGSTHLFVTVPGQPSAFRRAVDFAAEAVNGSRPAADVL